MPTGKRLVGLTMEEEEALEKEYGALSEDDYHRGYVAKLVKGKVVRVWRRRYLLNGWRIFAFHNPLRNATVWIIDREWSLTPARVCRDTLKEALRFASSQSPPAALETGRRE